MNIGIFTDSFTPEVNGVVTSLKLFISTFQARGHRVFVFAPDSEEPDRQPSEHNVTRFPSKLVWGKQVRLSLPLIATEQIAALNLDIVHTHTPGPIGLLGLYMGKKLGLPLVYTYHTRIESYARYYAHLPSWLEKGTLALSARFFYNKHSLIIAPSSGIKRELSAYVKKPIMVLPTGVDIATNRRLADKGEENFSFDRYGLKAIDELLITTSRLGKEKNIRLVMDIFARIKKSRPHARLIIAGDGPDKEALCAYALSVAHPDDILFLGFLTHEELFTLYRHARIFIFASQTETQGMAGLEAMAIGLPVVALSATGTEDLLQGNHGGYMADNAEELARQATILLENDEVWETKHAEALRRSEQFSIEAVAQKLLDAYSSLKR